VTVPESTFEISLYSGFKVRLWHWLRGVCGETKRFLNRLFPLWRVGSADYVTEPVRIEPVVSGYVRLRLPQLVQKSRVFKKNFGAPARFW
jgi:hypothetical protein